MPDYTENIYLPPSVRLVIFDLDGTLYDQQKLRIKVLFALICQLLTFRVSLLDLKIISTFRKQREAHKGHSSATLETDQYAWCAEKLSLPVYRIQQTVEAMMFKLPLKLLLKCRYPGVKDFFDTLKQRQIKTAIYSDYPVQEKLDALALTADNSFCSTHPEIGQLKPSAKALIKICVSFNCSINDVAYIGDREDTDGESAKLAGIRFIKLDGRNARKAYFYKQLIRAIELGNG